MRLGLVGYGNGGRLFHAPFIEAAQGVEIGGVVARSPRTRAAVEQDLPGVPVHGSLTQMLEAGVDAVTITTPPATRRELVLEALRTLQGVLEGGRLGELWRVHSRFDLDQPEQLEAGPEGGLLRDLGTHLVDQMMWLLGPVVSVHAQWDEVELPAGRTDAAFVLTLRHGSGVTSFVSSTKLNHLHERTLRAYGSAGSYAVTSADVQAEAVAAGRRPATGRESWGFDDPSRDGMLRTAAGEEWVPSAQGDYAVFYEQFARACAGEGPAPSPAYEGVAVLAVLDAAWESAVSGQVVRVRG